MASTQIIYTGTMLPIAIVAYFAGRGLVTAFLTQGWRRRELVGRATSRDILAWLWMAYAALILLLLVVGVSVVWAGPALVILAVGTVLRCLALRALGSWYAPDVRIYVAQPLVRSGPYRFLRHPLYLGLSLEALALGMACDSRAGIVLAVMVIVLSQIQNNRERVMLTRGLGDNYLQYRAETWDLEDLYTPPSFPRQRGSFAD